MIKDGAPWKWGASRLLGLRWATCQPLKRILPVKDKAAEKNAMIIRLEMRFVVK
jgi:hypothetical protein